MKRLFIILICAFMLVSCAPAVQEASTTDVVPTPAVTPAPTPEPNKIGLSLPAENEFYAAMAEYTRENAAQNGYEVVVAYDDNFNQGSQILEMLSSDIKGLMVVPSDPDALSQVFEDAYSAGIPVIGLMQSINARYDSLISPDYSEVGAKAARLCIEAAKDLDIEQPSVYALEGSPDSFIMQLIHNGLVSELEAKSDDELTVTFAGAHHFSKYDQEILEGFDVSAIGDANIVFAENSAIAAAFSAIAPENVQAIITIGSEPEVLQAVANKTYYASIVIGPKQFADEGVSELINAISGVDIPEFIMISTGVASESSIQDYIDQNLPFAEPVNS